MSKFLDGYSRAVRAKNLRSGGDDSGRVQHSDTLMAAAWAAKPVRAAQHPTKAREGNPLGVALLRLFVGGDREAKEVLRLLTEMLVSKAYRAGDTLGPAAADLIAAAVLDWHRNSVCPECGGHGFQTAVGELGGDSRVVMGDTPCPACHGTAKRPFDALFPPDRLWLALWLRERIEAKQAAAGVEAMRVLAPGFGVE